MTQPPDDAAELKAALYLLQDFLREDKRRRDRGVTLEKIHEEVLALKETYSTAAIKTDAHQRRIELLIEDQIAANMRLTRYAKRLRRVEKKISETDPSFVDEEDNTGNFRVEELKRAQELAELRRRVDERDNEIREREHERKDSGMWWRRQKRVWIAAMFLALFASALTILAGYALNRLTH